MLNNWRILILLIICAISFQPVLSDADARENSSELYKQGAQLALKGQLDDAIVVFKKVINLSPYYCLGHYGLGKAYMYKEGMMKEAILHLKLSVTYDRKYAKGYFYLGLAYFLSQKYTHALHSFKEAYTRDETMLEALLNIAIVYDQMENDYQALKYYNRYYYEKTREEDDSLF